MRILVWLFAAATIALSIAPAWACSCRCPADAATLAREVPLLFHGTATGGRASGATRRYSFAVRVAYKGAVPAKVVVTTPAETAACGARFPLGEDVLVGAYPDTDGVRANQCTQFCIGQKREELERILARCVSGRPCPPLD